MLHKYVLSISFFGIIVMMCNCTSDSGSPGPQPETSSPPKNPPMDSGVNAVNNNNNDFGVSGNLPYSLKSAVSSMLTEMKGVQITGNFDVDFANIMALHHRAAIAMSQLEIDGGKDTAMKDMAESIRNEQQQQLNELKRLTTNTPATDNKQGKNELEQSMNSMKSNLDTINVGDNMDSSFALMMKAHHREGIDLAQKEISHGKNPEVRALAQTIISNSGKEIKQLNDWMKIK